MKVEETSPDPVQSGQTITTSRWLSYTTAGQVAKARQQILKGALTVTLDETATYNNEGQMVTWKMPDTHVPAGSTYVCCATGPTYGFTYDNQGRVSGATYGGATLVSGVQYNAAGQVTSMSYEGWTETRQFNVLGQMTRLTVGGGVADWEYTFPASGNNGRITKMKDYVTGEEVNYQYDSLNRLIAAYTTGPEWGLTFSYDGFGNKLGQAVTKGSAPISNVTVDAATNRLNGYTYDANGNQYGSASTLYDVFNRMKTWDGAAYYAYGADNKRLLKKAGGTLEVTHYGLTGQRMFTYSVVSCAAYGTCWTAAAENVWFGGKLVRTGVPGSQASVVVDRLGSVRVRKVGGTTERLDYWPYGEEKPSATTQGREKFATYFRDGTLDYADQRHYGWQWGRFTTPDPAGDGLNWYAYVGGDPVNGNDPSGLKSSAKLVVASSRS